MWDQQHCLLNVLDLLEITGIDWKNLDLRNIEIFSLLLLLLSGSISNLQVTILALFDDVIVLDCSVNISMDCLIMS